MKLYLLVIVIAHLGHISAEVFYAKLRQSPQDNFHCLILEQNTIRKFKGFETNEVNEVKVLARAAVSAPADAKLTFSDDSKIIEIFAKTKLVLETHIDFVCKTKKTVPRLHSRKVGLLDEPEIRKIIDGGDQGNTILKDHETCDLCGDFFFFIEKCHHLSCSQNVIDSAYR